MNIQHSSRSDQWFTPPAILDLVRMVVGEIDLDPASSLEANELVRANRIITEAGDGLTADWGTPKSVYLNPPGGKIGKKSKTRLFWERLCSERDNFGHAIFMAFSVEALQTTQGSPQPMMRFPICVPAKRIAFVGPDMVVGRAPSHSNCIIYVPGKIDATQNFKEVFSSLGCVR